jgi:hypothetical protein
LEYLGLVKPQQPRPVWPTLGEAQAARHTSDLDVAQQLLIESAGGTGLPAVPLPDVPLPNILLTGAHPDGLGNKERTSPRIAEEAMAVAFGFGLGSFRVRFLCSNLINSVIDYYTCQEVFGSLEVYFIYGFCIRFIELVGVYT